MTASAGTGQRHLLVNATANWAGFAAQLLIAFFLSPILVHGLGDRRYGIWSLVESVLAYLMVVDLGVAASVVRYVAKFEATGDRDSLNRVFSTSLCIFTVAGALALALVLAIAFPGLSLLRIPADLAGEARGMLVLLGINLALGLPLSVFPSVLFGLGRFPVKTAIHTASLVIRAGLLLLVVWKEGGLPELALAITACNVVEHLVLALAAWSYVPSLRFSFALADRATFRAIRGYSLSAFVALLAGRISFQTDALVLALFLTPESITFFAIASRLVEYAKSALRAGTTVLTPAVSVLEAQGNDAAIRRVLLDGTRYVLWLSLPIQAGFVILGRPFLALWLGPKYAELSYPTLVILALPLALALSQSISGRILYGIGRLRWFAGLIMTEAVCNLLLSLALVVPLGLEGVAWGTAIPNVFCNLLLAVYICRTVGMSAGEYLRGSFLLPVALAPLPVVVWLAAARWLAPPSWPALVAVGALGLVSYLAAAVLVELGPRTVSLGLAASLRQARAARSPETRG
jgi:O-antigen/teichoic acid export membrane protein